MGPFKLAATAAFGLEGVVAGELKRLGYADAKGFDGGARFTGSLADAFRANLWLRSADRVLVYFGEFDALTFDELFEGVRALAWEDVLPRDAQLLVTAKCARSRLMSPSDVQSIGKKAIVERLKAHFHLNWLPEDGPRYHVDIHLHEDHVAVTLDTSGMGLSRRGYRTLNAQAPLRETLAAALIITSPWRPYLPFYDPMCGSGTLPIEAAMIALDRAPGLKRGFDMEQWVGVDASALQALRQEAQERFTAASAGRQLAIFGSDIDAGALRLCAAHRAQAGLNGKITFSQGALEQALPPCEMPGAVAANPPYGERLGDTAQAEATLRQFRGLMERLGGWSLTVISSHKGLERLVGRRCDRKRRVYNGRIECEIFQFLPFEGKGKKRR